ncbi:MAG: TonB-dependent receptor [Gammaproteobacteria bacterium]|nr:TonB-dependent receptor [Gammaproteobacteria bacterium]
MQFNTSAAVLAAAVSSVFFTKSLHANEETVTILGNRIQSSLSESLANIEIISRYDIERIQPTSINDLFLTISGFDLVTQGGDGQNSSLFVRGSSSDQTLILINGVRVGSATSGTKALSSISVQHIERIEIIKGPRAAIWGSDAIGAVINIVTRSYSNDEQGIAAKVGSNNYQSGVYSAAFGNEKLNNSVTVSSVTSKGFDVRNDLETDKDGYRRDTFSFVGDYQMSNNLNLDWTMMLNKGNNEFDSSFGGNESDYNDQLVTVRYSYNNDNWRSALNYGYSRDELSTYGNGIPKDEGDIFETRRHHIAGTLGYHFDGNTKIISGIERYLDTVNSRGFFASGEPRQTTMGGFLLAATKLGDLSLEGSVRHDEFQTKSIDSEVESDSTFSFTARYDLTENMFASVARGKGFKSPTLNDLYYPGFGNAELQPEISYSNELGFGFYNNNSKLNFVAYETDYRELIVFAFLGGSFAPYNVGLAEAKGYEIDYSINIGDFTHKLSFAHTDAKEIDPVTGAESKLIRRVVDAASYQVGYSYEDFTIFTQFIYKGERPDSDFSTFPATQVDLDSFVQVNLSATYQVNNHLSVSARVRDLTDEAPVNVVDYNSPGKQSYVTISYAF